MGGVAFFLSLTVKPATQTYAQATIRRRSARNGLNDVCFQSDGAVGDLSIRSAHPTIVYDASGFQVGE